MWHTVMIACMVAMTGVYSMMDETMPTVSARQAKADGMAQSMAVYRQAVLSYFEDKPELKKNVDTVAINDLIDGGMLPEWSTLNANPEATIWTNFRDNKGTIYIYAIARPPVDIVTDVLTLAYNSELVGLFRDGDRTLHSPVHGDTGIKLPPPGRARIPDGSPVWIALPSKERKA